MEWAEEIALHRPLRLIMLPQHFRALRAASIFRLAERPMSQLSPWSQNWVHFSRAADTRPKAAHVFKLHQTPRPATSGRPETVAGADFSLPRRLLIAGPWQVSAFNGRGCNSRRFADAESRRSGRHVFRLVIPWLAAVATNQRSRPPHEIRSEMADDVGCTNDRPVLGGRDLSVGVAIESRRTIQSRLVASVSPFEQVRKDLLTIR